MIPDLRMRNFKIGSGIVGFMTTSAPKSLQANLPEYLNRPNRSASHTPKLLLAAAALLLLSAGCATAAPPADFVEVASLEDFLPEWKPLFKGIDFAAGRLLGDVPQAAYALRVDLHAPGVELLATPSNGDKPGETDGRKTSAFLKEFKCQAAVNGSPFSPAQDGEGDPKDVRGLAISRGEQYSKPNKMYGAIIFGKDNRARIAEPPFNTDGAYNAVGGFALVLEEGKNVGADADRHPRTAVGLSKNGRFLYVLVIDGRQGAYSTGATTAETAQWLLRLGAWTALNLDGGGSTAMAVEGEDGEPKLVNRPVHNNIPGLERISANHLGIFARPLD